jgi:hypothetical protein
MKRYLKYWTLYFNTASPIDVDVTLNLIQLNLPTHKVLFLFAYAMEESFFTSVFHVEELDKFYYDVVLSFPKLTQKLEEIDNNDVVEVLK